MNAVIDSNILIDYLRGVPAARDELARYERTSVSVITWIEVMSGATPDEEPIVRQFLDGFELREVTAGIAERAVRLRRSGKVRLPDAIIWATALELGQMLVTRNTRDFPLDDPGVRVPYRL